MLKRLSILTVLIFGLIIYSGCSEDDDDDSPTSPTTTTDATRYLFDDDINAGDNITLSADTVYTLSGFVFVDSGATLTIPAGTVIKARPGTGVNASALIVARHGKIYAQGTATDPIIFTAESDDMTAPLNLRGLWGGVIILGDAVINTAAGEGQIEGIPSDEPRGAYGGNNDADDSGVFQYVSIRYGGSEIGEANEINGLTMGAVGSGTTIDHIEVVYNQDDGYEWFGGTVTCNYIISAFNGDDAFDYDEGFRGNGQFWFSLQATDAGERAGEHDGGTNPEDGMPYAIPVISNVTYIGSGESSGNDGNITFKIRDNAGAKYYNSIFYDFNDLAFDIEDLASGEDSRARLDAGDIDFQNNIWYAYGDGNVDTSLCKHDYEEILFTDAARNNWIVDPQIAGGDRTNGYDPRPSAAQATGTVFPAPTGHTPTNYLGAFEPGADLWVQGWSFVSTFGYTIQ